MIHRFPVAYLREKIASMRAERKNLSKIFQKFLVVSFRSREACIVVSPRVARVKIRDFTKKFTHFPCLTASRSESRDESASHVAPFFFNFVAEKCRKKVRCACNVSRA